MLKVSLPGYHRAEKMETDKVVECLRSGENRAAALKYHEIQHLSGNLSSRNIQSDMKLLKVVLRQRRRLDTSR